MSASPESSVLPSPWRGVGCAMLLLVVGIYGWLIPQTTALIDKDFSHLWLAGRMVTAGHARTLYDPQVQIQVHRAADPKGRPPLKWGERYEILGCFNYPPPAALYYALYGWMPLKHALLANSVVNVLLALLGALLMAKWLNLPDAWLWIPIAMLGSYTFFANLAVGQNAVITTVLIMCAWALHFQGRELMAGMMLGVLIFKPQWLFACAWIPVLYWRPRMIFGMCCSSILVSLLTIVVLGVQPFLDYVEQFQRVANIHTLTGYHLELKFNGLAVFRRLFGIGMISTVLGWASVATLISLTLLKTRGSFHSHSPTLHQTWFCLLMVVLWTNPHLNHYDLVLLTACCPILLLCRAGVTNPRWFVVTTLIGAASVLPHDRDWLPIMLPLPSLVLLMQWWLVLRSTSIQRPS